MATPTVLYQFKDRAGKSFRPSNGTEGDVFEQAFCEKCGEAIVVNGCQIHLFALAYDTHDPEYPKEWVFNSKGWPVCTAFEKME